jgi:N-acylneuraminate cytidylyltransferase
VNIAILPARGGSVRVPRKNVRSFAGKPMLHWPVETARSSGLIERIIVSTDDEETATLGRAAGAEVPFMRPAHLADDHCGTLEVIAHAVRWALSEGWDVTSACCIYPTAVFATPDDIADAHELLRRGQWDYVFAAGRYQRPVQRAFEGSADGSMRLLFPEHRLTRTQDLSAAYYDAGQFYWGTAAAWAEHRPIFGDRSSFIELPPTRAIDIDTEADWAKAEQQFVEWKQHAGD